MKGILERQWSRKRSYVMNIGEAVEQEEKLCDEVEKVREFTYLVYVNILFPPVCY